MEFRNEPGAWGGRRSTHVDRDEENLSTTSDLSGWDPAERLLLRDGHAVPVTPKAFDLLVYLVEHDGRLVEKHSLMSALWPDTVVEDGNLAYNMSALRKALEDGRDDAKFIETVPTRGYRFVAPVTRAEVGESGSGIRPRSRWRPTGNVTWLAIVALTVGVAVSVFVFRLGSSPRDPMRTISPHQSSWPGTRQFFTRWQPDRICLGRWKRKQPGYLYQGRRCGCPSSLDDASWCRPEAGLVVGRTPHCVCPHLRGGKRHLRDPRARWSRAQNRVTHPRT